MVNEDLSRYLWKGLNLKRYSVVRIIPQDSKHAVIIMFSNDEELNLLFVMQMGNVVRNEL